MDKINLSDILDQIKNITVMHPQFNAAFEGIKNLVYQSHLSGIPVGGSVTAPSGTGKSQLISVLKKEYIQNSNAISSGNAVVEIASSAMPNVSSFIERLLYVLGHPPGIRSKSLQDLRLTILLNAIQERNVQLIVIDEFQHIFRGKRDSSASEITDLLKEIIDKTRKPIFVFGTDELGDLSHIDTQFSSRLPARYQIRPFVRGDEWKAFLLAFHKASIFFDISIISDLESKIHASTNGSPRTLKFILLAAITNAYNQGRLKIEQADLTVGFKSIFGSASSISNPF